MSAPAAAPRKSTGRQFQVQRALYRRGCGLHPICRHLIMVLASRIDDEAGVILDDYQPSLTDLQRMTGWVRTTVMRRLGDIEAAGWVIRNRPAKADAQRHHARTRYTIVIPGEQPAAAAAAPPDPLGQLVASMLLERTGKTVTAETARAICRQILGTSRVRDPAAYISKAIANDPDPGRWVPKAPPPTLAEYEQELARLREEEPP
jgi:hypothetical protein